MPSPYLEARLLQKGSRCWPRELQSEPPGPRIKRTRRRPQLYEVFSEALRQPPRQIRHARGHHRSPYGIKWLRKGSRCLPTGLQSEPPGPRIKPIRRRTHLYKVFSEAFGQLPSQIRHARVHQMALVSRKSCPKVGSDHMVVRYSIGVSLKRWEIRYVGKTINK